MLRVKKVIRGEEYTFEKQANSDTVLVKDGTGKTVDLVNNTTVGGDIKLLEDVVERWIKK